MIRWLIPALLLAACALWFQSRQWQLWLIGPRHWAQMTLSSVVAIAVAAIVLCAAAGWIWRWPGRWRKARQGDWIKQVLIGWVSSGELPDVGLWPSARPDLSQWLSAWADLPSGKDQPLRKLLAASRDHDLIGISALWCQQHGALTDTHLARLPTVWANWLRLRRALDPAQRLETDEVGTVLLMVLRALKTLSPFCYRPLRRDLWSVMQLQPRLGPDPQREAHRLIRKIPAGMCGWQLDWACYHIERGECHLARDVASTIADRQPLAAAVLWLAAYEPSAPAKHWRGWQRQITAAETTGTRGLAKLLEGLFAWKLEQSARAKHCWQEIQTRPWAAYAARYAQWPTGSPTAPWPESWWRDLLAILLPQQALLRDPLIQGIWPTDTGIATL